MNVSGAFSSLHSGNVLCGQHLPHVSTGYSHVDPLGRLDGAGYVLLDSTTMVLPPTSCSTTSLLSPRFFSLSFFCCFVRGGEGWEVYNVVVVFCFCGFVLGGGGVFVFVLFFCLFVGGGAGWQGDELGPDFCV